MSVQNGLTITSANSVFLLGVTGVFPTAQQLGGYSADAAWAVADVEVGEFLLGVDGNLSAGWLPQMMKQTISLQADSTSGFLFETWQQAENAAKEKIGCFGVLTIPGIRRVYTLTGGYLGTTKPMPDAKKTLAPRDFVITWGSIVPAPIPG
jgi:hypothetical protein